MFKTVLVIYTLDFGDCLEFRISDLEFIISMEQNNGDI